MTKAELEAEQVEVRNERALGAAQPYRPVAYYS